MNHRVMEACNHQLYHVPHLLDSRHSRATFCCRYAAATRRSSSLSQYHSWLIFTKSSRFCPCAAATWCCSSNSSRLWCPPSSTTTPPTPAAGDGADAPPLAPSFAADDMTCSGLGSRQQLVGKSARWRTEPAPCGRVGEDRTEVALSHQRMPPGRWSATARFSFLRECSGAAGSVCVHSDTLELDSKSKQLLYK